MKDCKDFLWTFSWMYGTIRPASQSVLVSCWLLSSHRIQSPAVKKLKKTNKKHSACKEQMWIIYGVTQSHYVNMCILHISYAQLFVQNKIYF